MNEINRFIEKKQTMCILKNEFKIIFGEKEGD